MMRTEIQFWRAQATNGRLLKVVQSDRKRAISFFGARNVKRLDEYQLLYILDAYEVVCKSASELRSEVASWARITRSDIQNVDPDLQQRIIEGQKTPAELVVALKAAAQEAIKKALAQNDED